MKSYWLIEHPTPGLGLVYVPAKPGFFTMNPWEAKRFDTEEQAKEFMTSLAHLRYNPPWKAVSHGFEED